MILKGSQRSGGQDLAAHLMNAFDNERVEIAEMRGAIAQDLSGAFAEWEAQAGCTKCKKELFSLSISPDQAQRHLTPEEYRDIIDRTERSLGLVGQPRAVVFHEKYDMDTRTILREHCHVVWSRIDTEKMRAVPIPKDILKLRDVTREFCRDYGLKLPAGMKKGVKKDRQNTAENFAERQQHERTGIDKATRVSDITACWKETGGGTAFVQALEKKGYFIAQGDRRAFVVVDLHGEVYSLARQIEGARTKDLKQRLSGYPIDKLPGVEAARDYAKKERDQRQRTPMKEASDVETRRQKLKTTHQVRRATLDTMRINLIGRHMGERDGLKAAHESENAGVATARLKKQPKGIMAFLQRVTGLKMLAEAKQQRQDKARAAEHKQQTDALRRTHDRELSDMDRRYRALSRLEAKENRSVDLALRREQSLRLMKKPPERAPLPQTFDKAAKAPLDLTAEFNRQVDSRLARERDDRDLDGPDRTRDPRKR